MHSAILTLPNRAGRFFLCLVLPVLLVACQEGTEGNGGGVPEAGTTVPGGDPAGGTGISADTVRVTLLEYSIEMPATLSPGRTVFVVFNSGTTEHNFEIEGQGIEQVFPASLKPGETQMMAVDLRPGSYEVYCPVDNHRPRGMSVPLTIPGDPAPADTTAATDTTGSATP